MNITIRQELADDRQAVFKLIQKAFESEYYSDHKEQFLVERLRKSEAFIAELSLVAEYEGQIVGYILLSKIKIMGKEQQYDSLALSPVCVLPEYQKRGIGGMLINRAHQIAKELGHTSIILLGHENYYPRFGYKIASDFGISLPFDVPKENCMLVELQQDALKQIRGVVEYPKEFFE